MVWQGPAMMVGLVQNDLLNGNSENPREVFGDRLPAPMYPVIISRGTEGPGREILQRPPSVRPSVRHV